MGMPRRVRSRTEAPSVEPAARAGRRGGSGGWGASLRDEGSSLILPLARGAEPRRWQRHPHSAAPQGTGSGHSHGDFQPGHSPDPAGAGRGGGGRGPGSAAALGEAEPGPAVNHSEAAAGAAGADAELAALSAVENFLQEAVPGGIWVCCGFPLAAVLTGLKNTPPKWSTGLECARAPTGDGERGIAGADGPVAPLDP